MSIPVSRTRIIQALLLAEAAGEICFFLMGDLALAVTAGCVLLLGVVSWLASKKPTVRSMASALAKKVGSSDFHGSAFLYVTVNVVAVLVPWQVNLILVVLVQAVSMAVRRVQWRPRWWPKLQAWWTKMTTEPTSDAQ